jgi:hypothetical protein
VLKRAAAELKLLFQERRQTDHAEVPMAAMQALGPPEAPTPLAEALYARIEHLLVDEFQDTSASQYEILRRLTAEWVPGDGRTLFLVGDPMQSIYGFREADVGLFLQAAAAGLGHLPLEFVQLNRNFRSDRELIGWFNSVSPPCWPRPSTLRPGPCPTLPARRRATIRTVASSLVGAARSKSPMWWRRIRSRPSPSSCATRATRRP